MNFKRTDLLATVSILIMVILLGTVFLRRQQVRKASQQRISCVGNLKHIGLSFRIFANEHDNLYPMQIAAEQGGAREPLAAGQVWKVFQVPSNELSVPKTVICAADRDQRTPAINWTSFDNSNVSYFVGQDATDTKPEMLLAGDRNLALEGSLLSGAVSLNTGVLPAWTPDDIHRGRGNIGLADGSVQQVTTGMLRQHLTKTGDATNRVVFPQ
jgi:prepilin-type processing-associated H-X9-DG protein